MHEKQQFSPEESLQLIQAMIDRTRRSISVNSYVGGAMWEVWTAIALAILINYIIPCYIFRKQYNDGGLYATE